MSWGKKKKAPDIETIFIPAKQIKHSGGLKVAVYGDTETGKTHFALTFPEPIYVIDTEYGTEPLLWKQPFKDKEIYVTHVVELDKEGKVDIDRTIERVEWAMQAIVRNLPSKVEQLEPVATIVIDSVSDIWSWLIDWLDKHATRRLKDGKPMTTEFGIINDKYRNLIYAAISRAAHVVLTAKMDDEWIEGRRTGRKKK